MVHRVFLSSIHTGGLGIEILTTGVSLGGSSMLVSFNVSPVIQVIPDNDINNVIAVAAAIVNPQNT